MEHKQADDFLKGVINGLDTVPPEVNWQKERSWYILEEKLIPVKKQKTAFYWYYGIAASVLLVISISWVAFIYIHKQDKEIAQLKQKLDDVKAPERKPDVHTGTNTFDKNRSADGVQQTNTAINSSPVSPKKHKVSKRVQPEKSFVTDAVTDNTKHTEPVLIPEEEIKVATIAAEEKQQVKVKHPKSVQEMMLGKVKQHHLNGNNGNRKPIIIVFEGTQEEYMARQPVEAPQKTGPKIKLPHLIIHNKPESTAETLPYTGMEAYPRLYRERSN